MGIGLEALELGLQEINSATLHATVHAGDGEQLSKLLADPNLDPNSIRHTGRTILHVCAWRNHHQLLDAVLGNPRFTAHNRRDLHQLTALDLAICHLNMGVVARLLRDPRVQSTSSSLLRACETGNPRVVQLLVAHNRALRADYVSSYKGTPLRTAIFHHDLATVRLLLEELEADPCYGDHLCLQNLHLPDNRLDLIRLLMARSPKIDFQSQLHTWSPDPRQNPELLALLETYQRDPVETCSRMRNELCWAGQVARTYALVVFAGRELLVPGASSVCPDRVRRFFGIATQLHQDLQLVLANRIFGRGKDGIPHAERFQAMLRLAQAT